MHIDCLISKTSCKENTNFRTGCDAFPNSVLHSERHVTCPSGKRNNGFSQIAPNSRTHQKHPNFASFGCLQPCTITNFVSDTIPGINGIENNNINVSRGKTGQPLVYYSTFSISMIQT